MEQNKVGEEVQTQKQTSRKTWWLIGAGVLALVCCTMLAVPALIGYLVINQQTANDALARPPDGWVLTKSRFDNLDDWFEGEQISSEGTITYSFSDDNTFVWDISPKNGPLYAGQTSIAGEYRDFYVEVDFTQSEGDTTSSTYGLIFREAVNSKYEFSVSGQGSFRADGYLIGSHIPFYDWTTTNHVNLSGTNHLAVLGKRSTFWLFINGHYVGQFNSSTLGQGALGIFAKCYDESSGCRFVWSNFAAYKPK